MIDLGNGYRVSNNVCVRCYNNDPEYENGTDLYEFCPDCGELWVDTPKFTIPQIQNFYEYAHSTGRDILRSILNDRDAYINAKRIDPRWSDLTLEMANFSNQAMKLLSICKHTFQPLSIEKEPEYTLEEKVLVQEKHQFYLTRWVESGWSDLPAKRKMLELMDVMCSWPENTESSAKKECEECGNPDVGGPMPPVCCNACAGPFKLHELPDRKSGFLLQDVIYESDNGRLICSSCAGMSAFMTGYDISGRKVEPVPRSGRVGTTTYNKPIRCEKGCTSYKGVVR